MSRVKLTRELKSKWVKALESGDYRQGTGALYDETVGTYCCLGVLGEVCGVKGNPDDTFLQDGRKRSRVCGLSMKVQLELASMNDGMNGSQKTFAEIAAYIRKNVKAVKA